MKTPREKYQNDARYRAIVDLILNEIHAARFTPGELREAALLACILYEEHHLREYRLYEKPVEDALCVIEKWTDTNPHGRY